MPAETINKMSPARRLLVLALVMLAGVVAALSASQGPGDLPGSSRAAGNHSAGASSTADEPVLLARRGRGR